MGKNRRLSWIWIVAISVWFAACGGGGGGFDNSGTGGDDGDGGRSGTSHKSSPKPNVPDEPCHYNGHKLHVGPKGGCYYIYDGHKKEYVDHSYCKDCK